MMSVFLVLFALSAATVSGKETSHPPMGGLGLKALHIAAAPGRSWGLELDSAGTMAVWSLAEPLRRKLTADVIRNLRRTLEEQRFFELDNGYGTSLIEGDFREIHVVLDGREKTIALYSRLEEDARTDEIRRALRVWIAIRGLFDIPKAADSRPKDEALIQKDVRR
jgi:hypothetical protein